MTVAQAFSTPAPPSTQPALQIAGGAAVDIELSRDKSTQTTHVTIPQLAASKVSLTRGQRQYVFEKPINLKLTTDIAAADAIKQIDVKQLDGDLGGLAMIAMPAPLSVTNLNASTPTANGKIAISGPIEPLTRLLSVIQNADPMPYRGDYAITQSVGTQGNAIKLTGDATINNLVVLQADNKTPALSEDKLVVNNDLVADTTSKSATINNLALDMTSSKAANVVVKGAIQDWETKRQLQNVTVNLGYDLAKIWPIVKPMLSPDTQQTLKDLKIAGAFQKTINVSGSYPAADASGKALPSNVAIQSLVADGSIAVQSLNTNGIDLSDFELPFNLNKGQLVTLYANKPKAERAAKPAKFNGGTLDLSSILVDLTTPTSRVSIGKNQKLVAQASINTLLGDSLGKYINPVFTNTKQAKGLLDVTINECKNLALGHELQSANSGSLTMTLNLTDMQIANPLGSLLIGKFISGLNSIPGVKLTLGQNASETFEGYIKNGTINLAKGQTTQDITMQLIDRGKTPDAGAAPTAGKSKAPPPVYMPMTFKGDINLKTQAENINVSLPPQFVSVYFAGGAQKSINDAFPDGIPVTLTGTTKDPKVNYPDIFTKVAKGLVGGELGNLLGGGDKKNNATNGDKGNDIGNTINDIFGGGDKKKKKK